jgi:hypothetical protein
MTEGKVRVTVHTSSSPAGSLPLTNGLSEYAVLLTWLMREGVLEEIETRFRLDRSGGYAGIDLVLVLFAYLCAVDDFEGMRSFCEEVRYRHGTALAALGGRDGWPSQASVSRMSASVDMAGAESFIEWLLTESVDCSALSKHESALYRDCSGAHWHVFSFDPTVTPLRRRALPAGEDLPEPRRRTDGFADPGYSGRKRGELQVSRATLQHRGTGLYHMIGLTGGNTDMRDELHRVVAHLKHWSASIEESSERCVVVVDGDSGGWPQVEILADSGVQFVTRLAAYREFKDAAFVDQLNARQWQRVDDSKSGPTRWARELGTKKIDGHEVRLVATRFESRKNKKRGCGVLIEGSQYEVFATQLDATAWPASELVTLYYARTGQENHFGLEDKALGLDHIFSYELGGQILATGVGLWLWNLRILQGVEQAGGLAELPRTQQPRNVATKTFDDTPLKPESLETDEDAETVETVETVETTETVETVETTEIVDPKTWIADQLKAYQWSGRFKSMPDWTTDSASNRPICPEGVCFRILAPRRRSAKLEVRFQGLRSACNGCSRRPSCSTSRSGAYFLKELSIRIPIPPGFDVDDFDRPNNPGASRAANKPARKQVGPLLPSTRDQPPGAYEMSMPWLVAPELMRLSQQAMRGATVEVDVTSPPRPAKTPAYYATTNARRQRRRQTWSQRLQWNALPPNSHVSIHITHVEGRPIARIANLGENVA